MKRIRGILPFLIVLAALSTGCSAGDASAERSAVGATDSTTVANTSETKLASQPTIDPKLKNAVQTQRAVIRNGSLSVRVPDIEKTEKQVNDYVRQLGGYISNSESSDLSSTAPTISMSVRIPVAKFDSALEYFEQLGTRMEKKVSGEDVTSKIVDFEARLKIMQAQEDSFRNMLSKSRNSQESLDLQTRLMNLRSEIESLSAQRKTLSDLASLSTIELTLISESRSIAQTNDQGWAKESWNSATTLMANVLRIAGSVLIFFVVFAPFWAPVAYLIWRSLKKGKQAPTFQP